MRVAWAVDQLPAAPGAILEVGCGGGHALLLLRARFPRAEITGIDRSAIQSARARSLAGESVRVETLALDDAPAALGGFDTVLAINVNAFWTDPAPSLASLARLLRPGARAFLVYEPPSASQLAALRERLPPLLREHGFAVEDVREAASCVCVVAGPHPQRRSATHPPPPKLPGGGGR